MREFTEIQIDPDHPRFRRLAREATSVMFVLGCIVLASCIVWFFGFSDRGSRGSRQQSAGQIAATPEAAAHPTVELSLSDVALVVDRGAKSKIKAYAKRLVGSPHVDLSSVRLRWASECPSVVSVDSLGNITAHNPGSAFVNVSVANRDIHSNATRCLVTVREKATPDLAEEIGEGIEVFDGAAVYDEVNHLIVFRDVKKFVVKGKRNHSVTMRPGDRIYDVRIRGGRLISGKFVKGTNSSTIKGLDEAL